MTKARGGATTRQTIRHGVSAEAERALAAWRILTHGVRLARLSKHEVHQRQGGRCYLCPQPFGRAARSQNCTREHVFPKASGATGDTNILLAHQVCNQAKGDRWPRPCEVLFLAAVYAAPSAPRGAAA